jgi:hypothetical protein
MKAAAFILFRADHICVRCRTRLRFIDRDSYWSGDKRWEPTRFWLLVPIAVFEARLLIVSKLPLWPWSPVWIIAMSALLTIAVLVGAVRPRPPLLTLSLRLTLWALRSEIVLNEGLRRSTGERLRLPAVGLLLWWIWRHSLQGRCETIRDSALVVVIFLSFSLAGRPHISSLGLLLSLLCSCDNPKIMLGMLQIAFCHHRIAG